MRCVFRSARVEAALDRLGQSLRMPGSMGRASLGHAQGDRLQSDYSRLCSPQNSGGGVVTATGAPAGS